MQIRILSFLVVATLSANAVSAFTVRASAMNEATMCCLPSGEERTSIKATHLAIATEPDDVEWFNARVNYTFLTTPKCDYSGVPFINRVGAFRITPQGNSVTQTFLSLDYPCPFGVRSKARTQTSGGPTLLVFLSETLCRQPCNDCQAPPFEE